MQSIYVDKILKGTKPADLPIQSPTKYETVDQSQDSQGLGLDVPPSLLVLADEVIEKPPADVVCCGA